MSSSNYDNLMLRNLVFRVKFTQVWWWVHGYDSNVRWAAKTFPTRTVHFRNISWVGAQGRAPQHASLSFHVKETTTFVHLWNPWIGQGAVWHWRLLCLPDYSWSGLYHVLTFKKTNLSYSKNIIHNKNLSFLNKQQEADKCKYLAANIVFSKLKSHFSYVFYRFDFKRIWIAIPVWL